MGMMLRYHRGKGVKTPPPQKTETEVKETPKKIKKEGKKNDFGR